MDYPMPRTDDLRSPGNALHPVPCRSNALGVKGVGEAGTTASLAAVMNAVADALPESTACRRRPRGYGTRSITRLNRAFRRAFAGDPPSPFETADEANRRGLADAPEGPAELRALGITLTRLPGEYRVNYRNGTDATARLA